jgi:membrane-associated phospholipid phosphatase
MILPMDPVEGKLGVGLGLHQRVWRRVGRRADGRAPLWIELAIIAWLFWLYDVINDLAPLRRALALRDATQLLAFERSLGLDPELTLNRWLARHATLATIASDYYFFAHAVITFAALALLWWRAPALYRRLRTPLVVINLIAFVVFWRYPLAPPRSFPALGFVDVIARSGALVSWHSGVLVHDSDQFAAMPSLHVAWAIWSAIAVWGLTRRPALRAIAAIYPLLTSVIVLATGNHYLLDVLAGAATAGLAFAVDYAARLALRRWRVRIRRPAAPPAGVSPPSPEFAPGRGDPAPAARSSALTAATATDPCAGRDPAPGRISAQP